MRPGQVIWFDTKEELLSFQQRYAHPRNELLLASCRLKQSHATSNAVIRKLSSALASQRVLTKPTFLWARLWMLRLRLWLILALVKYFKMGNSMPISWP